MKKAIAIFLCLILLITLCSCDTSYISEGIDRIGEAFSELSSGYDVVVTQSEATTLEPSEIIENEDYYFCFQKLNQKQKKLYRIFLTAAEEMPKNFINLGVCDDSSMADIMVSYRAMLYDHPEIFWMPYTYIIGYNKEMEKTEILTAFDYKDDDHNSKYAMSKAQRDVCRRSLNNLLKTVTGYANDYQTVYEKLLFFNDFICDNTVYDKNNKLGHTAYGCIMNGEAVCEGYSKAFQLLCRNSGIKCELVCGVSQDEDHMWNCVNIGGEWSYTDVTWNDDETDTFKYVYLNITEKQLLFDHKPAELLENIDKASLENGKVFNFTKHSCTDISNTYYAKNDALISSDFSKVAKLIAEKRYNGEEYAGFMIADDKTKKMVDEDIESVIAAVQRKLFTFSLESYSQVRDIIVFYWN